MKTINLTWNAKQTELIKGLATHSKFFIEGGVRSGKSLAVLWMIDYLCRKQPGTVCLILRKSYESIKTDTHVILEKNPGILAVADENGRKKGSWKDGKRQFNYSNGSVIYFRHTEGAEDLLGTTAGILFFEQAELMKEEDFDLLSQTRLSQWGGDNLQTKQYLSNLGPSIAAGKYLTPRNYLFITANPKASWIKARYIDKDPALEGIKHFHLSTYDNMDNLGQEYIDSMANVSASFRQRYYEGSWQFNAGLVYPQFNESNMVEPPFDLDLQFATMRTYMAVDPGYAKSKFAVLMCSVLPDGRIYVFDEVVKNGKKVEEWEKVGIPEVVTEIRHRYDKHKFQPSRGLIDPASNAMIAGMESITKQFQRYGIILGNAKKPAEMETIFRIQQLLKEKKIIVNSRCVNLIREFGLFRWHEKKLDVPLDEDNDCLDCLRYIINESPRPEILSQQEDPWANVQDAWLKSWYGKEEVTAKRFKINQGGPLDFGL